MGHLSGTEWSVKSTLDYEKSSLDSVDPKERWDMTPKEIDIVKKWMTRRTEELNNKLKGND